MHRSSLPPVQVPIAIPDGCGTKERLEGVIVKGNNSGMQFLLETRKKMEKVENILKAWYLSSTKYWKGILICTSSYGNHGTSNQRGDSLANISSIGITAETRKKLHTSSFNCHVAGNAVTFWLCECNINLFYGWSWAIFGRIPHSEPTWHGNTPCRNIFWSNKKPNAFAKLLGDLSVSVWPFF